jgi:hypothetical protein
LSVYDVLGRRVAVLVEGRVDAGNHTAVFNAEGFPSGVYFYTLVAGTSRETRRMLLLK